MLATILPDCPPERALAIETAGKRFATVGIRLSAPRVVDGKKVIDVSITEDEDCAIYLLYHSAEFAHVMDTRGGIWRAAAAERWEGVYDPPKVKKPRKEKPAGSSAEKTAKPPRTPKEKPPVDPARAAVNALRDLPIGVLSDKELTLKISRLTREVRVGGNRKLIPLLQRAEQERAARKLVVRKMGHKDLASLRLAAVGGFATPSTSGNVRTYKCR